MKIKFNESTMDVIKNFSAINPSLYFRKGSDLRTISPNKTILAKVKIDQNLESDFAIYNLPLFTSVLSMLKNPECEIFDRHMIIHGEGNRSVKFVFASPDTFITPPDRDIEIPSVDVSFELTSEMLGDALKALNVMHLPNLVVTNQDGRVVLRAMDASKVNLNSYDVVVGECNEDIQFNVVMLASNLKMIPANYTVQISKQGMAKFFNERSTYFVSVESNSTFD